jgi:hypothetical protein
MRSFPALLATVAVLLVLPTAAAAQDLLLVPYLGFTFAGGSALLDLESGSSESASVVGASAVLVGGGWLGAEADIAWVPGFFERGSQGLVTSSAVTTFTGAAVVTLPVSVTRESLRPYLVVGGGLLRAELRESLATLGFRSAMPALVVGGGAVGFLNSTVGVRFDLRHLRSLGQGDELIVGEGPRVRFWRGSIGLVLRY